MRDLYDAGELVHGTGDRPLFLKALRIEKQLTACAITGLSICRVLADLVCPATQDYDEVMDPRG